MRERALIVFIVVFALGIRLAYLAHIRQTPLSNSDEMNYENLGWNLASGKGFVNPDGTPTTRRAPMAPAFFALIYLIFGHSIHIARIGQAVVSAATCYLIYLLGKGVFNIKIGIISAGIAALYPAFIYFTGILFLETLLLFLLTLSLYLMLRKTRVPYINAFLGGLAFGAASLTRVSLLALPFIILFAQAKFKKASLQEIIKKALLTMLAMSIVIAPWTVRNYRLFNKFVLVNSQLGYTLLNSYFYPKEGFGFNNKELVDKLARNTGSDIERSRLLTEYTLINVMKNPARFIRLLPLKFLWFWDPFGGKDYLLPSSYNIIYGLTLLFFLFGLAGSRHIGRGLLPLYAVISYFVFISLIFFGCQRYRMQVEPVMIILAAYGIVWSLKKRRNKFILAMLIGGLIINLSLFFLADDAAAFSKRAANIFGYNAFGESQK